MLAQYGLTHTNNFQFRHLLVVKKTVVSVGKKEETVFALSCLKSRFILILLGIRIHGQKYNNGYLF